MNPLVFCGCSTIVLQPQNTNRCGEASSHDVVICVVICVVIRNDQDDVRGIEECGERQKPKSPNRFSKSPIRAVVEKEITKAIQK